VPEVDLVESVEPEPELPQAVIQGWADYSPGLLVGYRATARLPQAAEELRRSTSLEVEAAGEE